MGGRACVWDVPSCILVVAQLTKAHLGTSRAWARAHIVALVDLFMLRWSGHVEQMNDSKVVKYMYPRVGVEGQAWCVKGARVNYNGTY